jgi:hypothetical protein
VAGERCVDRAEAVINVEEQRRRAPAAMSTTGGDARAIARSQGQDQRKSKDQGISGRRDVSIWLDKSKRMKLTLISSRTGARSRSFQQ